MKKNAVVYFSKTGSNKFLAEKAAEALDCEAFQIRPRVGSLIPLLLASSTGLSFGNRPLGMDFSEYDQVTLCGPLWMGRIAAPVKDFIRKYEGGVKKLNFITCCGSSDEARNDKFGYALAFAGFKELTADKCGICEAFPIDLLLSGAEREDGEAMMKTRLTESNFSGDIKTRLDEFIGKIV